MSIKLFYLSCEFDFEGANLCSNSGVYLSKEKAIAVLAEGFPFNEWIDYENLADLEEAGMFEIEEVEIE